MPRLLIYCAGKAGRELANALAFNEEINIVGFFFDDDKNLSYRKINGLTVYHPSNVAQISSDFLVSEVILAMPSITRNQRNIIIDNLRLAKVSVRQIPSYSDLVRGRITLDEIRELSIDDILGREVVEPDHSLMLADVKGQVVLVTGAGGTIGSELCRQIIHLEPNKIILFEQSELALYSILGELEKHLLQSNITKNVLSCQSSVQRLIKIEFNLC